MLESAESELRRLGYEITSRSDYEIVGVARKRYLNALGLAKTTVVFVRATGPLSAAGIQGEQARMVATAMKAVGGRPFRHPLLVAAYTADSVDVDAQALCTSLPMPRLDALYYPAALDR